MEITHTFKLPSGVEVELKKLKGLHQRWLTEKSKDTFKDRLYKILVDRIIRVGSCTRVDAKFLKGVIDGDLSKMLIELRQFTMKHDPKFTFNWKYKSEKTGRYEIHTHTEALPEGIFPQKAMRVVGAGGEAVDATFTEYDQVLEAKNIQIVLPESQEIVRFTMLDGIASERASHMKKKDISSHTQIKLRNPVKFIESKNPDTVRMIPISLNLDDLDYLDLEYIRAAIEKFEGKVFTTITFDHPEDIGRLVEQDVLAAASFFFPSEITA